MGMRESGATDVFKHDEKKVLIMLALLNGEDGKDPLWERDGMVGFFFSFLKRDQNTFGVEQDEES